ncbi:MAG: helix-turn-helix domain-containing protein [Opitutales bacterium]
MKELGLTIRHLQNKRGFSGQELARLVGITGSSLSQIVNGHAKPRQWRGSLNGVVSLARSNSRKSSVNSGSWSCSIHFLPRRNPSMQSVRLRPICIIKSPEYWQPMWVISTFRLRRSITKWTRYMTSPRSVQTGTMKKSVAAS